MALHKYIFIFLIQQSHQFRGGRSRKITCCFVDNLAHRVFLKVDAITIMKEIITLSSVYTEGGCEMLKDAKHT